MISEMFVLGVSVTIVLIEVIRRDFESERKKATQKLEEEKEREELAKRGRRQNAILWDLGERLDKVEDILMLLKDDVRANQGRIGTGITKKLFLEDEKNKDTKIESPVVSENKTLGKKEGWWW